MSYLKIPLYSSGQWTNKCRLSRKRILLSVLAVNATSTLSTLIQAGVAS